MSALPSNDVRMPAAVTGPVPQLSQTAPARRARPSTLMVFVWLIVLTGIAAFLRYWRLGYQAYWTDEAYTIRRIQGSFEYMLNQLTDQGFPPGWYALLRWWCLAIEKITHNGAWAFSPASTRGLAALFGTLTVPAMYFLARQFTDRRGALLVTLLAAVNPFFIYYSRDIKMYPAFWFFVVLNMAIFFRWQTTHRHWLWFPLYALTGACMTITHTMAWFMVGLQLIFLLTRPRLRSWDGPLWLLGVGLMSLFPIYWFLEYLQPAIWMKRVSAQSDAGMSWLSRYTDMSGATLLGLPTSHLLGYLWPVYPPDARIMDWFSLGGDFKNHLATRSSAMVARWEGYVAMILFAILLLGLIPWRRLGKHATTVDPERLASVTRGRWWWVALWIVLPSTVLALTWIPPESPWFARVWHGFSPKPIWEPRYLGILVPAWLLWLGASLRRLPTMSLRAVAIVFVVGASIAGALTNHLIYRNTPYHRPAEIAELYSNKADRGTAAVVMPMVSFWDTAENAAFTVARRVRPGEGDETWMIGSRYWTTLETEDDILEWVRGILPTKPRVETLVITDRYGDLTDPADPLSDKSMGKLLGPRWKLVHEETYRYYYEWRFYIFHTWRTRVWQRSGRPAVPGSIFN